MVKRISNITFYTLLLSVYAIFFSVQFYNHDGQSGPGHGIHLTPHPSDCPRPPDLGARPTSSRSPAAHGPATHTIRLNKRFHQENISPCAVICLEAPRQYTLRRTLGVCPDPFLPFFTPLHRPLRGPPVIA